MNKGLTDTHGGSLYDVLQVSPNASQEVIQAAYRALARACHPDVNPGPAAAQRMLELNSAYAVLGDTRQRAEYDLRRVRSHRTVVTSIRSVAPVSSPSPAPTIVRGKPGPRSPVRIEQQRAATGASRPAWQGRSRVVMAVAFFLVLLMAATLALWLVAAFLDEVPSAFAYEPMPRSSMLNAVYGIESSIVTATRSTVS
jgi:hypothetical protein